MEQRSIEKSFEKHVSIGSSVQIRLSKFTPYSESDCNVVKKIFRRHSFSFAFTQLGFGLDTQNLSVLRHCNLLYSVFMARTDV